VAVKITEYQTMTIVNAFNIISGWSDLPPTDPLIGFGGAYEVTAYAVFSEHLAGCQNEKDLRLAIEKGMRLMQTGMKSPHDFASASRQVFAAVRSKGDGLLDLN
jgi:hypothetical protein